MYIVYKATHKPSNKVYIGRTKEALEVRIHWHWRDKNKNKTKLHKLMKDSTKEDWTWEIIATVEKYEEWLDCEMYYINLYDSYNSGLNSTSGAHKQEHLKNSSIRMREYKKQNPEPWNKGRKQVYSEKTLELMRLAKLKNPTATKWTEKQKLEQSLKATNSVEIVEMATGLQFNSISRAAKHFNLRREQVRDVVNGKRSHTKGHVFVTLDYYKTWLERAYKHLILQQK